jgi:ABC-2 type transport system permease protein
MTAYLAADLRAFGAAAMKEWRLLRRYPGRLFGFLFWPIALPLAYVYQARGYAGGSQAALDAFAHRAGTTEIAGFLFLGWAAYMWISMILWALWMFAVVGGALVLLYGVPISPLAALRAVGVVLVAVPALYGLGALFATVVLRFGEVGALVQVVRGLFTVFCGMTFPIVILPEWGRALALALPPTYLIGDLRSVLLTSSDLASLAPSLVMMLALGIGLCGFAIVAFRRTERFARRGGSLAQY